MVFVVNIYLQMAFAIHLVSLGHHDLLNELVDDLRRQLRQPRHLSGPLNKMLNALIAHERAMNLASNVVVDMQMEGVQISLEPSPTDLRGLTHRELGDHTDTLALLMEAPNPAQGRLRDRTDEALVLTGKSETYVKAGEIGQLYVPYDENGWPIEVRCARHVFGIERILANYSEMYEEPIIVTGMPSYDELVKNGMGPYLNEPTT